MDDIASKIEHTVLDPHPEWAAVQEGLDTAIQYGMRACVPPCYVDRALEYAPSVSVTSVVGFPHGHHTTETKCQEAEQAWRNGAAEIDVVANLGYVTGDELDAFETELTEVIAAVPIPVKVILESARYEPSTLRQAGEAASAAGADFLKTSTGFSDGGAMVEDVALLSEYLPVKASGGVDSWAFARELFEAGAERIGASSGDVIVNEYRDSLE